MLSKRVTVVALVFFGDFAVAQSARAEEHARVMWSAPASCPTAEEVSVLVDRALGHEWPSDLEAKAAVTALESGRFKVDLVISVRGVAGGRIIEGQSCARLANATALVIATAADSAATIGATPPDRPAVSPAIEESETPQEAAPPERPTAAAGPIVPSRLVTGAPARTDAVPERLPSPSGYFRAGAHTFGVAGVFPTANVGVGPNVTLVLGHAWFEAAFVYWFEQTIHRGPRLGSGGELELASAHVRACRHLLDVPPELGACVGASAGTFRGHGFGLSNAERTVQPWAVVTAGLDVRRRVSGTLWWSTGVDVGVSVVRPSFAIDGFGIAAQASWIVAQLKAGVELDFL